MPPSLSRRTFLTAVPTGVALTQLWPQSASAFPPDPAAAAGTSFPRPPLDLIREVVGASHRNLDRVREIVDASPALANASWDWGFGDWETPLGAASHVGRPDIAAYLIGKGAKVDVFAAAMLGHLDVVKALVAAHPGIQRGHGPHGITLLAHAKANEEKAAAVVEFLTALGDADNGYKPLPVPDEQRAAVSGAYIITDDAAQTRFEITEAKKGGLVLKHTGTFEIRLFRNAEREYHPGGAPTVRLRFAMEGTKATGATIIDGARTVTATRA